MLKSPPEDFSDMAPTKAEGATLSLTTEAIALLEEYRVQNASASLSDALELLLREWRDQQQRAQEKMAALDREITRYYDEMSDEEIAERREWGDFASAEFFKS